jgi:hypothetical protein
MGRWHLKEAAVDAQAHQGILTGAALERVRARLGEAEAGSATASHQKERRREGGGTKIVAGRERLRSSSTPP